MKQAQSVLSPRYMSDMNANSSVSENRLETFCEGVIAIAITFLVIEIKVSYLYESSADQFLMGLQARLPVLLATVLSFVITRCYWVDHHQLMRSVLSINHGFVLLALLPCRR